MVVAYILVLYYSTSFMVIFGLLVAMRRVYAVEKVRVPWWPYTKLTLIPFIGSIFAVFMIYYDFKHHVVNHERRRRKEILENEQR